jgi:hypothetical protein
VEFEKVCQDFEILNTRNLGEEIKVFLVEKNCDVIRTLYSNFQKGLSCQNLVATLLSNSVNKLGFEEPLWVGKITSCNHVFHCWWAYSQLGTYPKG